MEKTFPVFGIDVKLADAGSALIPFRIVRGFPPAGNRLYFSEWDFALIFPNKAMMASGA